MSVLTYDAVAPSEAEEILNYAIDGGESLLVYGVDDFSEIVSWLNLVDLSLEFVPSCRESFHGCVDWFGTNRERVEVALSILRDARSKVHNPRYFGVYEPSNAYVMLIERVCGGSPRPEDLSIPPKPEVFLAGIILSEETNESKNY